MMLRFLEHRALLLEAWPAFVLVFTVFLQFCIASSQQGCPKVGLENSEVVQQLRSFMQSHGANVSHLCVKESLSGGRGLFANKFLTSVEPLFSVPEDVIMDPIRPRPADIKNVLKKHSPDSISDALLLFILACRRMQMCSEHWKPLFQSFPQHADMHLPMLWTSSERQLLKGTNAYLSLKREHESLSDALKIVNSALRASRLPEASVEEATYTHAIIVSRAFDLKFPGRHNLTRVLIPFVDMFNHKSDVQISYGFDHVGAQNALFFKVSTNVSLEISAEAFVNYGNFNDSSSNMFMQYGMSVPATASDHFQIMPSIAPDDLFDLKQDALRAAGIDVNVRDISLSISLSGEVAPKLIRCIAVLTSNKTHSARLKDIALGNFLPKSLEVAAISSLSQGIMGVLEGFESDLDKVTRVHPYRLALARHQVQLEKSILTRFVLESLLLFFFRFPRISFFTSFPRGLQKLKKRRRRLEREMEDEL
jgi:hypothetical protein